MRVDDADLDDVADAGDNCLGLVNGDQADTDADGKGDACDDDDDGDGRPDAEDRCPTEFAVKGDGDGCRNPKSRLRRAAARAALSRVAVTPDRPRRRRRARHPARGGRRRAAARRQRRRRQAHAARSWSPGSRTFVERACSSPLWRVARGQDAWRISLQRGVLSSGSYAAFVRARQNEGPLERRRVFKRNVRTFSVGQ